MIAAIGLGLFFWTMLVGSLLRLPPLHPLQLWALPWMVTTTLFTVHLLPYRWLSLGTAGLVVAATLAFGLGVLAAERAYGRLRPVTENPQVPAASLRLAAGAALVLTAVGTGAFILDLGRAIGLQAALTSSGGARHAVVNGAGAQTIVYLYFAFAACALCGLASGRTHGREAGHWSTGAALAVGSTFFSTGRTFMLIAAATAVSAFVIGRNRPVRLSHLITGVLASGLVALGGFVLVASLQDRTIESSPSSALFPASFVSTSRSHSSAARTST